jgi:heterodisulfide reductase subunit B
MSLLDDGAAWLAGQLVDHASHAIAYTQGAATISLRGTRDVQRVRVVQANGVQTIVRQVSFVVRSSDMTIAPQRGDQIAETVGGSVVRWELAPEPNGAVWQYESAGEEMMRLFVVEVA